jgi:hypothetical protein
VFGVVDESDGVSCYQVYNGRQTPSDDKSSRELKILQEIWIAYLLIQETKRTLSFLKK